MATTTHRSDLTTEIEKALTDEAYDGAMGQLSEAEFLRYVRRLAELAVEVVESEAVSALPALRYDDEPLGDDQQSHRDDGEPEGRAHNAREDQHGAQRPEDGAENHQSEADASHRVSFWHSTTMSPPRADVDRSRGVSHV